MTHEKNLRTLLIPPKIGQSPEAFEILRVWLARTGPHFSVLPDVWEDPAAWGLLLADVARHVANGLSGGNTSKRDAVLSRIRNGIDAELAHPTTDTPGGFVPNDE